MRRFHWFFDGWAKWAPPTFEWLHPLGKGNQLDNQNWSHNDARTARSCFFFIVLKFFWLQGLYEIDHGFLRYAQSSMKQSLESTNMKDRKLALVISIHFTATIQCHAYFDKPKPWWYDCHGGISACIKGHLEKYLLTLVLTIRSSDSWQSRYLISVTFLIHIVCVCVGIVYFQLPSVCGVHVSLLVYNTDISIYIYSIYMYVYLHGHIRSIFTCASRNFIPPRQTSRDTKVPVAPKHLPNQTSAV